MSEYVLLDCLYPNRCVMCNDIILNANEPLCEYCLTRINNINFNNMCMRCGHEKEYCICKFREFHFEAITTAFRKDGIAQVAYYAYKLGKRREFASFFARKTADAVMLTFGGIKFDGVCCVPTAHRSKLKRGFDHNEIIARQIAVLLKTKYLDGVIKSRHFRPMQHNSIPSKRLENVRGKYYTVNAIKANRILLFDDIVTTGATIDECAKELMFAGVREVYCASVLSTYLNKKQGGVKKDGN